MKTGGEDMENEKRLISALDEWNLHNECICNIEDAITKLAGEKKDFSWAISELTTALVEAAEERTRYTIKLESMGVKEPGEVLALAAKYLL